MLIKEGVVDMKHGTSIFSAENKRTLYQKGGKWCWSIFRALLLIGLAYVLLYPILYMISMSVRDINDMFDVTVNWLPKNLTLYTLKRVWTATDYPLTLGRTVLVSVLCSVFSAFTCSLAAYGMSRFKFKGQGILFAVMLFTIIVPQYFYNMPTYINFMNFNPYGIGSIIKLFTGEYPNILSTLWAMLLPAIFGVGIRAGLFIYLFRQTFKGLPRELEEAAYIDGCGYIRTFYNIIVPSSVAVFVTVFLFSFVWYWNDYQVGALLLNDEYLTLSTALVNITNLTYQLDMTTTAQSADTVRMALDRQGASLLTVAPVLLVYLSLQRFFTESIERTGLVE